MNRGNTLWCSMSRSMLLLLVSLFILSTEMVQHTEKNYHINLINIRESVYFVLILYALVVSIFRFLWGFSIFGFRDLLSRVDSSSWRLEVIGLFFITLLFPEPFTWMI